MSRAVDRRRPAILLTGFGPFPGAPRNASAELAEALAHLAVRQLPGYRVLAATLPTEWHEGLRQVADLLDEIEPVVALHFGVSRRARGFVIEMRARNKMAMVTDACGAMPSTKEVSHQGAAELASQLPSALIATRLRRLGLPVHVSRDAGTYLCNAVLYASLDNARRRPDGGASLKRGFVHLPDRLVTAPAAERGTLRRALPTRLDWDGAVRGGMAILTACVGATERATATA